MLVDSAEGVMPQTKFVLSKALKQGLKPIVVINKLDKSDQRADEVLNETFDLFVSLDANEDQLDFPVLYASGRSGWASKDIDGPRENLNPLLDLVLDHVKPSQFDRSKPFAMLSTLLYADNFLGRSFCPESYQRKVVSIALQMVLICQIERVLHDLKLNLIVD